MTRKDSISVKLLGPSKAELLARIAREAFLDAYADSTRPEDLQAYLDANYCPALQEAELRDPGVISLLASVAKTPAGFAQLRPGTPPDSVTGRAPLQLQRFYLLRPYWGNGAADVLMRRCLAEAAGRGYRTLWLSCWDRNLRALAFYRKWRFVPAGRAPFRVGSDLQTDLILERGVP